MSQSMEVTATEFGRNFGLYREHAYSVEVVKVTNHGRIVGGYLSAKELAHFEKLKRREVEVFRVGEMPDDVVADIQAAEYGSIPT